LSTCGVIFFKIRLVKKRVSTICLEMVTGHFYEPKRDTVFPRDRALDSLKQKGETYEVENATFET